MKAERATRDKDKGKKSKRQEKKYWKEIEKRQSGQKVMKSLNIAKRSRGWNSKRWKKAFALTVVKVLRIGRRFSRKTHRPRSTQKVKRRRENEFNQYGNISRYSWQNVHVTWIIIKSHRLIFEVRQHSVYLIVQWIVETRLQKVYLLSFNIHWMFSLRST